MRALGRQDRLFSTRDSRALLLSSSGAIRARIRGGDVRVGLLLEVRNTVLFLANFLRLLEARRFGEGETLVERTKRRDQRQANDDTPN